MDYIALWATALLERPARTIKKTVEVSGERNKHLGPRYDYAKVDVCFEAAAAFEVVDLVEYEENLARLGYPNMFVFGILDILLTSGPMPLTKLRIILKKAHYDEIDSSSLAFLEAGRDAGRKLIATL